MEGYCDTVDGKLVLKKTEFMFVERSCQYNDLHRATTLILWDPDRKIQVRLSPTDCCWRGESWHSFTRCHLGGWMDSSKEENKGKLVEGKAEHKEESKGKLVKNEVKPETQARG